MPQKTILENSKKLQKNDLVVQSIFTKYKNGQFIKSCNEFNKFIKTNSIGDFIWIAQKHLKITPHIILTTLRNISN